MLGSKTKKVVAISVTASNTLISFLPIFFNIVISSCIKIRQNLDNLTYLPKLFQHHPQNRFADFIVNIILSYWKNFFNRFFIFLPFGVKIYFGFQQNNCGKLTMNCDKYFKYIQMIIFDKTEHKSSVYSSFYVDLKSKSQAKLCHFAERKSSSRL